MCVLVVIVPDFLTETKNIQAFHSYGVSMNGETNLTALLASMTPCLLPGVFVFSTMPARTALPERLQPVMIFREAEGATLILERSVAIAANLSHVFPSRMITLQIHSSLEAVGFLAVITPRLAAAGIWINPVSAYFHDHLFVLENRADDAINIMQEIAAEARRS